MSNLVINYLQISELKGAKHNSRQHSDLQINQIIESIKQFGFTNPLLIDEDNCLIAGHGRLMAADRMGLKEVPTIVLSGLSETQKRAYLIADNKLALNATWDVDILRTELLELNDLKFNINVIGFDELELKSILMPFDPATQDDQGKLDVIAPKICPNCGHEFIK